jgi:hypothetical protein
MQFSIRRSAAKVAVAVLLANTLWQGCHAESKESSSISWYRGNTHTHTDNSDGDSAPDVVARWYREHGYQFLFITDHEYVTDVAPLNALLGATERFLVLPGQEVTQWSDDPKRASSRVNAQIGAGAHVNALFAKQVVWPIGQRGCLDPGCGANFPASEPLREAFRINIAAILNEGAIAQVNHPNLLWSLRPEDLIDITDGTLLEVWNGCCAIVNNLGGDDGKGDVRPSAEGIWDWLLSRGKIVWGVGSDDSHAFQAPRTNSPDEAGPGRAWIMVRASALTAADLQQAISNGNFYASTGVTLDDVVVTGNELVLAIRPEAMANPSWASPRYATRFVGDNGEILATIAGQRPAYRFKGSEGYVRAVVTDSNGKKAWTQPVFLDRRGKRRMANATRYH